MTYLSFVLTHAGTFAYRGKGEVTCDVPDEAPHAWSVSLRLSHAEADEFDAWHDRQAPLHLSTEPDGAASVLVEAVARHDRGARATLRGAGYCPVAAHAGRETPAGDD